MTPRPLVWAVLVALGAPACTSEDGVAIEAAELTGEDCDALALDYASELEARSLAALAAPADDPNETTEGVYAALNSTFVGLANAARGRLDCDTDAFVATAEQTLSDDFKTRVPRWLSSVDAGNDWSQYREVLRDNVEEAIHPPEGSQGARSGG